MSWGVVATVDEPAPLIAAFAGWHIAQGAREVHLYLDRPNPEAEALLAPLPGVTLTLCDDAYWTTMQGGTRPERQTGRQVKNANHAQGRANVDWLLQCDADEFVADGARIKQAITDIDPRTHVLRLRVIERVGLLDTPAAHIFDGIFRRRDWQFQTHAEAIYGRWTRFLGYGMTGHLVGKVMVRQGSARRFDIHMARRVPGGAVEKQEVKLDDALLHFDGITRAHFIAKMLRRGDIRHFMKGDGPDGVFRQDQIRFLLRNTARPGRVRAFHDGIKTLGPQQIAALKERDLIVERRFDPRPALADLGVEVDLTPEAFDRALVRRDPAFFARYAALFDALNEKGAG